MARRHPRSSFSSEVLSLFRKMKRAEVCSDAYSKLQNEIREQLRLPVWRAGPTSPYDDSQGYADSRDDDVALWRELDEAAAARRPARRGASR